MQSNIRRDKGKFRLDELVIMHRYQIRHVQSSETKIDKYEEVMQSYESRNEHLGLVTV